ncbi:MAG: hypothetical protein GY950_09710 [bacterium]|nr:hypothetical protein [bacterium]
MKALIIDFTNNSEVKILNTRITSSVSIVAGYYISLPEGDDPVAAAAAKLKQEKLIDTPAHIIPPRDFVQAHIFHFPPMPDKEINKVLPREIASVTDSADPMVYNFIKNGMVQDRQTEKLEIAAFFSKKEGAFEFLNRLKSEGISPAKIIPEIQGLKSVIETNKDLAPERSGTVFMDLMAGRISLNIFKGPNWGLEREFVFQFEPSDELHGEDLSRISIELNRTIQYFKQRNRTYTIDKVILYGGNPNIGHLRDFIDDNHPVSAEIITPDLFKVKISYPSHLKDKDEFLRLFTLPVSVSLSLTRKKVLNLFPREFTEKENLPRRLLGLTVSAVVIGSILVAGAFWLEKVKGSYKQDIEGTRKTFLSLSKNAALIESTRQLRAGYFRKRFFADFPPRYSYGAANFVRRLSLVTPDGVKLGKLELNPTAAGQAFSFALNGSIIADDNIGAQAAFLRFYQQLKDFEDMVQISFSTIKVKAGDAVKAAPSRQTVTPGGAETPKAEENQVELFFTINGEVELE